MITHQRLYALILLVLSSLSLIADPNPLRAQQERATVKAAPLTAFTEMSKKSDVTATLPTGKSVQITFSAVNEEGTWCAVSDIGSSEKLGFVHCDGLDRPNAPSAGVFSPAVPSLNPVFAASNITTLSLAQKRWALAASAILATANHESVTTLSPGESALEAASMLRNSWDISNHDELLQSLDWIDRGGHRQLFSAIGARTANVSSDDLSNVVRRLGSEDANSVLVAHRYHEKYAAQSITAWDYARYINVCRWGVAAGYLTDEEAWTHIMHAAQVLQQTFSSWSEFGENYLVGREFWSLHQTKIDGEEMRSIYRRLLNTPGSAWNRSPWNLSLPSSDSTSPIVPQDPSSADAGTGGSRCEALEHAAADGRISEAESILQTEPDLVNCRDSRTWTPLHSAALHGQAAMIQMLLTHHASPDAADKDGDTPLHAAASAGSADAIEALAQNGAQIDAVNHLGDTPLQNAAAEGSVPATEALLRHQAATEKHDHSGHVPLHTAAMRGRADVVRVLLEHGANVEAKDNDGSTPLYAAAWSQQPDIVAMLLAGKADANARTNGGFTPLHAAAEVGCAQCASLLLEYGAHVNAGTAHGFTPLHTAATDNQTEVAEILVAHGAEINARNDSGDTPLHWAAGFGHVEMTELLIAHGADLKAKTRFGCTPLRGAYDEHQTATAQVLLRHGAAL